MCPIACKRCVGVPMSVKRNRPKGARFASFGLGLCGVFALTPSEVGYQDIASLLARQPGVTERWQKRVVASSAAKIQVATFSFGRPIGTTSPLSPRAQLASLEATGSIGQVGRNPLLQPPRRYEASDFPTVDRTLKGDRLAVARPDAPAPEEPPAAGENADAADIVDGKSAARFPAGDPPLDPELAEALHAPPLASSYDLSLSLESQPLGSSGAEIGLSETTVQPAHDSFSLKTATLFFGSASIGLSGGLESWQPGEEPTIVAPDGFDPDMKIAVAPPQVATTPDVGESVASKGEVNADNQRAKTPAQRLGLFDDKLRAKHEKCLAEAVYFESRGEAVRGQIAVAQVVLNRAFSGFYPDNVCGVVYQNKHRRYACQFTFACDRTADVVREPDMWDRARKIAKAMLDGQLWLPEVAKSTHYHAYWVRPSWVHEMKKMYKFGVHTFYRPRNWGDGSDAPSWGNQEQTAAISAKLAEAAKSSAEMGEPARH
uniref:Cell wall hydrolase, SleB n=1 Tax=Rhodopseudomonas palustris (strain BisA53) TaxID=316055 RepID=Q07IA6_RHOP5